MNEITGCLVEMGNDDTGQPRMVIYTSSKAIMACDVNMLYHDVTVRLKTDLACPPSAPFHTDPIAELSRRCKLRELVEDVRAAHSPGPSPGDPIDVVVDDQGVGEITGGTMGEL